MKRKKNVNTFLVKGVHVNYAVDGRKKNLTMKDHIKGIMYELKHPDKQDVSLCYPIPASIIKSVTIGKLVGIPRCINHPDFWRANEFECVVDLEFIVELNYNLHG